MNLHLVDSLVGQVRDGIRSLVGRDDSSEGISRSPEGHDSIEGTDTYLLGGDRFEAMVARGEGPGKVEVVEGDSRFPIEIVLAPLVVPAAIYAAVSLPVIALAGAAVLAAGCGQEPGDPADPFPQPPPSATDTDGGRGPKADCFPPQNPLVGKFVVQVDAQPDPKIDGCMAVAVDRGDFSNPERLLMRYASTSTANDPRTDFYMDMRKYGQSLADFITGTGALPTLPGFDPKKLGLVYVGVKVPASIENGTYPTSLQGAALVNNTPTQPQNYIAIEAYTPLSNGTIVCKAGPADNTGMIANANLVILDMRDPQGQLVPVSLACPSGSQTAAAAVLCDDADASKPCTGTGGRVRMGAARKVTMPFL